VDIFPMRHDEFHAMELARSARHLWKANPDASIELEVASAEDTILEKLLWYRAGGSVSDRQWSDLLGIVETRDVDWAYLREWAAKLDVADLLERLRAETRR